MKSFRLALALAVGTALFQFFVRHDTYDLVSYGFVVPLLLSIPRLMFARTDRVNRRWLSVADVGGLIAVSMCAIGTLVLHRMGIQYDRLLHFSMGALGVLLWIMIAMTTRSWEPETRLTARVFIWPTIVTLFGLFLFEGHQYMTDRLLGTHMFHDAVQPIARDFWEDIIFGTLGMLAALPLLGRHLSFLESLRATASGRES